jgi:hypothetical protein
MSTPDWALARVREIVEVVRQRWNPADGMITDLVVDAFAAELRKEREAADKHLADKRAIVLRTNKTNSEMAKMVYDLEERAEAAEKRAAALEAAANRAIENRVEDDGEVCAAKDCDCTQCILREALRDHGGALADHDRATRHRAIADAKGWISTRLDTIAAHHVGCLLDELAEEGAKP